MSKKNKDLCMKYLNMKDNNVLYDDVLSAGEEKYIELKDGRVLMPNPIFMMTNFYLEKEKFDIKETHDNIKFYIKINEDVIYLFYQKYSLDEDRFITRFKIILQS